MQYRQLYHNDFKTSLLGMGCMRLPRASVSKLAIDKKASTQIIDYAYDHGVNYFDTAYNYHLGKSEPFLGRALKRYPRNSFNIATKMPGWLLQRNKSVAENKARAFKIFEKQLRLCRVDYFDFYLCHNVNEKSIDNYIDFEIIDLLERIKREGKIRKLGFSSHGKPDMLRRFVSLCDWDFAQIQLNYLDWDIQNAEEQYNILAGRDIPITVMEPLRGGRLASICPESDAILKAAAPERSIASWGLRWVAEKPMVQTILSGMNSMEQIKDNVATLSEAALLSEAERVALDEAIAVFRKKLYIPCTGCNYCEGCPKGIDIPKLIDMFNKFNISNNQAAFAARSGVPEEKHPKNCTACGRCTQHCPQNLDIPGVMREIAGRFPVRRRRNPMAALIRLVKG